MGFPISGELLDACVLGALSSEPAYGYELGQKFGLALGLSETALYPVLRRLMKDGQLSTYDEPFDGRNRRYYKITDHGANTLARHRDEWRSYRAGVNAFLGNDNISDNKITGGRS